MNVHRLLVETTNRLSGGPFDFRFDVSRLSTNQDFLRSSHMVTVEMISPIFFSEFQASFGPDERHPASLLLTWDRPATNVHGQPNALVHLQQYESRGVYGVTAESPYVSRKTMGVVLQGDTLNKAGALTFRLLQESEDGFSPCSENSFGTDFRFMLVFWTYPRPENPLAHDYYRIFLVSATRISGTTANCLVPILINTNGSMDVINHTWMVVVESISLIRSSTVS